jgi:hypothetical protein
VGQGTGEATVPLVELLDAVPKEDLASKGGTIVVVEKSGRGGSEVRRPRVGEGSRAY